LLRLQHPISILPPIPAIPVLLPVPAKFCHRAARARGVVPPCLPGSFYVLWGREVFAPGLLGYSFFRGLIAAHSCPPSPREMSLVFSSLGRPGQARMSSRTSPQGAAVWMATAALFTALSLSEAIFPMFFGMFRIPPPLLETPGNTGDTVIPGFFHALTLLSGTDVQRSARRRRRESSNHK
jgi:hypothetical protein